MITYWDTSAVIALIFAEQHSAAAEIAKKAATQYYAWHWLQAEAHCAIARRAGDAASYAKLSLWCAEANWLDLPSDSYPALFALNQRHRLRAADAGHLYCFRQASIVLPELQLVAFDSELTGAARAEGLRVWQPS